MYFRVLWSIWVISLGLSWFEYLESLGYENEDDIRVLWLLYVDSELWDCIEFGGDEILLMLDIRLVLLVVRCWNNDFFFNLFLIDIILFNGFLDGLLLCGFIEDLGILLYFCLRNFMIVNFLLYFGFSWFDFWTTTLLFFERFWVYLFESLIVLLFGGDIFFCGELGFFLFLCVLIIVLWLLGICLSLLFILLLFFFFLFTYYFSFLCVFIGKWLLIVYLISLSLSFFIICFLLRRFEVFFFEFKLELFFIFEFLLFDFLFFFKFFDVRLFLEFFLWGLRSFWICWSFLVSRVDFICFRLL